MARFLDAKPAIEYLRGLGGVMRYLLPVAIGLVLLGVLTYFCVGKHSPVIEADLRGKSLTALQEA